MKLLAFTDLHADLAMLSELGKVAQKEKVDYIVCCGDFTVFGRNVDKILAEINKLPRKVILIAGNHEIGEIHKHSLKQYKNLYYIHGRALTIDDTVFFGYGGDGFSLVNREFEAYAKEFMKWYEEEKGMKRTVVVFHGPPYGTKVDHIYGKHVGNKSYWQFLKTFQPTLCLCGHLHECFGKQDKVGKTIVLNPGPSGAIIEL